MSREWCSAQAWRLTAPGRMDLETAAPLARWDGVVSYATEELFELGRMAYPFPSLDSFEYRPPQVLRVEVTVDMRRSTLIGPEYQTETQTEYGMEFLVRREGVWDVLRFHRGQFQPGGWDQVIFWAQPWVDSAEISRISLKEGKLDGR